ncbi:RluA family pseudouridine synthase [Breznakiellaceae bacterium SP9]
MEIQAKVDDDGRRLDRILRKAFPALPLSNIHRFLRKKKILIDGTSKTVCAGTLVCAGQRITVPDSWEESAIKAISPATTPHTLHSFILKEELGLLFLNKPKGLAVHGPDSLDSLVRSYLAPKLPPSLSFTPGPLHRLDQGTSGVITFSTTLKGAQFFTQSLQEGSVRKRYLALVDGIIARNETWEDFLYRDSKQKKTLLCEPATDTAKRAVTSVRPLASTAQNSGKQSPVTLIMAEIGTGRTHQIRAQAAIHRSPLCGDVKYGGTTLKEGFFLHAYSLTLFQENPNSPEFTIQAPVPVPFRKKIKELFGESLVFENLRAIVLGN